MVTNQVALIIRIGCYSLKPLNYIEGDTKMSKDKSRLDFIQDTQLCVIGGDYFTVIDADTDGPEYRYKKSESVREAIDNAMAEIGVSQEVSNNGWIKCSNELPAIFNHDGFERSDIVMCFGIEEPDDSETYILAYMVPGNRFYGFDGECAKITHWRPLPAPPDEFSFKN